MAEQDPNDPQTMEQLRSASVEAVAQQLRLIHTLKQRARTGPGGPELGTIDNVVGAAQDLGHDLARLSVQQLTQWLTMGSKVVERITDSVAGGPAHGTSRLRIELTGPKGKPAVQRFVIENPFPVAADVSFTIPVFRAEVGGAVIAADVEFTRIYAAGDPVCGNTLAPRQTGVFQTQVTLDASAVVNAAYVGESRVLAGTRVVGELAMRIMVTA